MVYHLWKKRKCMTLITNKISKKRSRAFSLLAFEKGAYVEKISPNKLRLNKVNIQ
jgi:hypothetical protein